MPGEIGKRSVPQYSTGKVHRSVIPLMPMLKQAVGQAAVPSVPLSTRNCLHKRQCYFAESVV